MNATRLADLVEALELSAQDMQADGGAVPTVFAKRLTRSMVCTSALKGGHGLISSSQMAQCSSQATVQ
jgi:hypothetical protein